MVRAFALFLHNFTREPGGFLSRLSLTLCKPGQGFFSSAINWNTYSYWLLQSSAMLLFHLHIHILCIAVALWFLFLSQYYPLGPFGAPFMRISSVTLREAELHTDYLFCSANCPYFLYFSSLLSRDRWSLFVQAHRLTLDSLHLRVTEAHTGRLHTLLLLVVRAKKYPASCRKSGERASYRGRS